MKIGFSGSRHAGTLQQRDSLRGFLSGRDHAGVTLHHGDCLGFDTLAHAIALSLKWRIVKNPGPVSVWSAYSLGADEIRAWRTHFARNRDIVDETDMLVACPPTEGHRPRGGTWYTIDYAANVGKPIALVLPSGLIMEHKGRTSDDGMVDLPWFQRPPAPPAGNAGG